MNTRRIDAPIVVRSSSIGLGAALRERARAGVERVAAKYFGRLNAATVYFSRDGRGYRCTVNIDMGALRIVTGESLGFCCHAVFDAAMRKAAKQLRRSKRALRDDKLPRSGRILRGAPARRRSWERRGRRAGTAPQVDTLVLAKFRGFGPNDWEEPERWLDGPAPEAAVPRKAEEVGSARTERRIAFAPEAPVGTPGERP